ncbi:MAG TPA: CHAD domain-containing protein [Xanthobacteraceae bacterium]|nr:CHAD domain-containing protein [Xanthobacteraceae bacterium]
MTLSERLPPNERTDGPGPPAAEKLRPDLDAAAAFSAIARTCLRQFRKHQAAYLASGEPEGVHQMRVALRRLRCAFAFFKPMIDDDDFVAQVGAVKRLFAALGEVRDLDVFLAGLADQSAAGARRATLTRQAQAARTVADLKLTTALKDARTLRRLTALATWIETGSWTRTQGEDARRLRTMALSRFAQALLETRTRRIRKDVRRFKKLDAARRHRVRLRVKALRYACGWFGPLFTAPKARTRCAKFTARLEDLQDQLGRLNDLAIARDIAGRLAGEAPGKDDAEVVAALASARKAAGRWADRRGFWDGAAEVA